VAVLRSLQRSAGNAAVGGLLGGAVTVQRWPWSSKTDEQRIEDAIKDRDAREALAIKEKAKIPVEKRRQIIGIIVDDYTPAAAESLMVLWLDVPGGFSAFATANLPLLQKSLAVCPSLRSIRPIQDLQRDFLADVRRRAQDNAEANRNFVVERKQALGLAPGGAAPSADEMAQLRRNVQSIAWDVYTARQKQKQLRTITVGKTRTSGRMMTSGDFPFDPANPPKPDAVVPAGTPWAEVKKVWDEGDRHISGYASLYPEIYQAVADPDPDNRLLELTRATSQAFGGVAAGSLDRLLENIQKAKKVIEGGELNLLDLGELHKQLFHGSAKGTHAWQDETSLPAFVARQMIAQHKTDEKALARLLGGVVGLAVLVATFATAGSFAFFVASAVAVGVPAIQGVAGLYEADKLDVVAKAAPKTGREIVLQSQADEKASEAQLKLFEAAVAALLAGATYGSELMAAARLRALVPDAALLARLRGLCPDAKLLERLLLKVERPETLEKYLGRMGPAELEKAIATTAASGVPQGFTQQQFADMSARIRSAAGKYGDDIRVQGSRAAGAAGKETKDIDVAIRVSPERFDEIIKERFKAPNPGSVKEKTMLHAVATGKIQRGELGLSGVGRQIEKEIGMEIDISVVRVGGPTDNGPWMALK
jgi:hypothetical protein